MELLIMLIKRSFLVIISIFLAGILLHSEEEDFSLRFRSGRILAAELIPGESVGRLVKNIDPYAPPSKVTMDVGYAAIIVNLDTGRNISIYDYVLKDSSGQEFPCVAIREKDGDFDSSKWIYENALQNNIFTLLFRVQMPPANQPLRYTLQFNLLNTKDSVSVPFVKLKDKPLTDPKLFPETGILLAPAEKIKEFYAKIYSDTDKTNKN